MEELSPPKMNASKKLLELENSSQPVFSRILFFRQALFLPYPFVYFLRRSHYIAHAGLSLISTPKCLDYRSAGTPDSPSFKILQIFLGSLYHVWD